MGTTAWAAQPRRRPWFSWRGLMRGLAIVVPILLLAGYVGIAGYTADKLTKPDRKVVVDTPAKYGLAYRDVQFNSTTDQIPLKGWLIDTPGDKVIVMLHGRGGTRLTDDGLEKASLLAGHGYDVFTFDMSAHGQSGGERYGMGALETRDVAGALA